MIRTAYFATSLLNVPWVWGVNFYQWDTFLLVKVYAIPSFAEAYEKEAVFLK